MIGATVDLWLVGHNVLGPTALGAFAAPIRTTDGTLTINGTGSLEAHAGGGTAAIGGIGGENSGTVIINGGNISVFGTESGTGLGGTNHATAGSGILIINGGIVTARGGIWDISGAIGVGTQLTLNGGLLEIASQWIDGRNGATTTINGGNLSIADPTNDLRSQTTHNGQPAFRVEIFLYNNGYLSFGNHAVVEYMLNNTTINAITDSSGRLFMYMPEGDTQGRMFFNGNWFSGSVIVGDDHQARLVLTLEEGGNDDTSRPPIRPSQARRGLWFQIGANEAQGMRLHIEAMNAYALGLIDTQGRSIINLLQESGYSIQPLVHILDTTLSRTNAERASLGAAQNRLEYATRSLNKAYENLTESKSRIRDADMAKEMMRLVKGNLLKQAAVGVLVQANRGAEGILRLL